jgi:hypothetical protein
LVKKRSFLGVELGMEVLKPFFYCGGKDCRIISGKILEICRKILARLIEDGQVAAVDIRRPGGHYAIYRIKPDSLRDFQNERDRIFMIEAFGAEIEAG